VAIGVYSEALVNNGSIIWFADSIGFFKVVNMALLCRLKEFFRVFYCCRFRILLLTTSF
jgi:hypothetical protein